MGSRVLTALAVPDSWGRPMTRIVIIDGHPSTREGLTTRIELEPNLEVCGEAAGVEEGLQLIIATSPNLAIIDVSLMSGSGSSWSSGSELATCPQVCSCARNTARAR